MKKLLSTLAAALLVFFAVAPHPQANAADRVLKHVKVCKYTITDLASDAVLTQANGQAYCDVSDMIPERVVIESNITAITGTNVIFKAISTSDPTNAGATTDPPLLGSDGSTALVSATLTSTGRASKGTSVPVAGTSGVGMNLGTKIGVWADTSSITDLDGFVYLTVIGRQ
jgi:hypothetical protein